MADADVVFGDAAEQGRRFRSGALSPVDLLRAYLERIERLDGDLNAFVTVCAERALSQARRAENDFAAGRVRSPLQGIPFAVKDQMLVEGVRLTGGSRVLVEHVAARTATVVARLEDAGAVLVGTLNSHEFHSGPTRDFPFGLPRNPGTGSGRRARRRAGRRPRWRRASARSRWAATRAGRSAGRPPSAGWSV
jgi:aspartyl-tRNA(Asn)/glutamyl-tRNA(Gln) amidotransferase subunit A